MTLWKIAHSYGMNAMEKFIYEVFVPQIAMIIQMIIYNIFNRDGL